jgi:hypothetical protein
MAPEALTPDAVMAAANIVLGALLLVASLTVVAGAWLARMPASMMAGTVAIVLLCLTTLLSAFARLETGVIPNISLLLSTLRFSALILLAAAGWTLAARYMRRPTL